MNFLIKVVGGINEDEFGNFGLDGTYLFLNFGRILFFLQEDLNDILIFIIDFNILKHLLGRVFFVHYEIFII